MIPLPLPQPDEDSLGPQPDEDSLGLVKTGTQCLAYSHKNTKRTTIGYMSISDSLLSFQKPKSPRDERSLWQHRIGLIWNIATVILGFSHLRHLSINCRNWMDISVCVEPDWILNRPRIIYHHIIRETKEGSFTYHVSFVNNTNEFGLIDPSSSINLISFLERKSSIVRHLDWRLMGAHIPITKTPRCKTII
jgi:hypothetical protein